MIYFVDKISRRKQLGEINPPPPTITHGSGPHPPLPQLPLLQQARAENHLTGLAILLLKIRMPMAGCSEIQQATATHDDIRTSCALSLSVVLFFKFFFLPTLNEIKIKKYFLRTHTRHTVLRAVDY